MGIQDTDIMNILFLIYILQYDKKDNIKFDYYRDATADNKRSFNV